MALSSRSELQGLLDVLQLPWPETAEDFDNVEKRVCVVLSRSPMAAGQQSTSLPPPRSRSLRVDDPVTIEYEDDEDDDVTMVEDGLDVACLADDSIIMLSVGVLSCPSRPCPRLARENRDSRRALALADERLIQAIGRGGMCIGLLGVGNWEV